MLKEPRPGRVKTRLGDDIGMTTSAWWFRHQSKRLLRNLASDPRWHTVIAVSPDTEGMQSRIWPVHLSRWPQGQGNLGDRMLRVFHRCGHGPIVIIGADIPDITPKLINTAFKKLGSHDAVFGPAPDGGYWLIGLKRGVQPVPRNLFQNVRWSSPHTLADTMGNLGNAKIALIKELQDIDVLNDMKANIK